MIDWNGVFPAITTKFKADGSLDLDLFIHNIDAQLAAGVHGLILGGTLGESATLSDEEKMIITKACLSHVNGKVPVILNIAEASTAIACDWAHKAEKIGVQGLMLLPPMRYNADHREVVGFFKTIALSTSLPIMIYNNPVDYNVTVTLEMFDELIALENIQAVKESTRDISNITRMLNRYGDRIAILCGVDTLAMESLLMGAHGWVAGLVCAFPRETVVIFELIKQGRVAEALEIYRWFLPLLELDIHPKLVQYIKLAEEAVGIGSAHVRAPRLELIGKEREDVLTIIENGLKNRPILPKI